MGVSVSGRGMVSSKAQREDKVGMTEAARENQRGWRALGDGETGRSQRSEGKAGGRPHRTSDTHRKGLGVYSRCSWKAEIKGKYMIKFLKITLVALWKTNCRDGDGKLLGEEGSWANPEPVQGQMPCSEAQVGLAHPNPGASSQVRLY